MREAAKGRRRLPENITVAGKTAKKEGPHGTRVDKNKEVLK